jgi:uncharacterized protein
MTNVQTVQDVYAAFGRGDIPAILERLAEDVAWEQELPGYGVAYLEAGTGRDHVAKFFAALDALEFEHFEPLNLLVGGDQVAAVVRVHTRNKGNGRRIRDQEVHLWTFGSNGLVTRFDHVIDRHGHVCAWRDEDA